MLRNTVLLFPGPGAHRGKYATVLELSRRGVHRGRGTRGKRGRTGLPTSCSAPSPLGRIVRHRQLGADLVWEAYNLDIGGVE